MSACVLAVLQSHVQCSGCILLCVSLLFKIRRNNVCMFSLSPQSPRYMAQPIPVSLPFYKHIFTQLIGINLEENVHENKHTVFLSKIKNLNTNLKMKNQHQNHVTYAEILHTSRKLSGKPKRHHGACQRVIITAFAPLSGTHHVNQK